MKTTTIFRKALHFFSLESELEHQDSVYEEIKKGIVFKGTNLWILIFAIIVASVGLNMNSTAVIIGAMLISPLMGPINGMGYSIATYDFDLFRKSVKNFSFAILASLVASTLYFVLSPVSTAHSELLARTSPTIYDVLIALFGGLAGIVAISSKQKGNVIPGVAIATALMPPLCTAGYGLATRQFDFFFGAFYLFTINTIFIAIASVWISQILKFPIRTIVDEGKKKRIDRTITLVITIVLLPSIFFGYKLVKQERFSQNANSYVSNISVFEGQYLLKNKIDAYANKITLIYGGTGLSEQQKNAIIQKSKDFNIEEAEITIEQGLTFNNMDNANIELFSLKEQNIILNNLLSKKNSELDSIVSHQKFGQSIFNEIKAIYPQITGCIYAESSSFSDTLQSALPIPVVILSFKSSLRDADKQKIRSWLVQRLKNNAVKVYYE
ncbi:MAG: TIGR00341 family protein [Paludibacter sp.]|nr:TIGR00341 family protein [Paludibacter sp.]